MSAPSNVSLFRWEVVDLKKQRKDTQRKGGLTSNLFTLSAHQSVQFEMFIQYGEGGMKKQNNVRLILKQFGGKPIEASVRLWIEHTSNQKFAETFIENHVFSKVGDFCGYRGLIGDEYNTLNNLYQKHDTFFFCCEITHLNRRTTSITENYQKFQQSIWTMYEEEFHDAVIKAGGTEFKVMKAFFMVHSKVFKSMFLSKFKEGVTNEVEIQDIDAETMKHLVKWIYTCQLEDDAPIEKLFEAADKYDIALLKEMCTENMLDNLDFTNAFQRLIIASMHNNKELERATLNVIAGLTATDFSDFLASEEWLEFYGKNPGTAKEVAKLIREKMHE